MRSAGEGDRHLQIAVANSLRDAKHDKLRVPGCPCRDLETGQRCKATRGGGSWYTITFGDGKTASRRAEQLEPLEEPSEPVAAPAAPPTPPPPAPAPAVPHSSVSSDEAIALALQREDAAPATPAPAAAPSTPVAEAAPAQPPIATAAEEVTAPVAMELEPAAAPAEAPELAELQELHGPLGAWYAASGLAHGEYPATPEGLAEWPAFGEMTERFLKATM